MTVPSINPLDKIKKLHSLIDERRKAYDEGLKRDMPFERLKEIFVEIKALEKQLEHAFTNNINQ